MSQAAVGQVYAKVIDAVCDQSQVDFEEGGIDQGTLELLKSGWRKKLSDLKVASMPWEPAPAPTPVQSVPSVSTSAVKHQPQSVPSNGTTAPPASSAGSSSLRANDGTQIKAEPGSFSGSTSQSGGFSMPQLPQFPPGSMPTAQQRAAMNLAHRYGDQAAQQINQLQQQSGPQRLPNLPNAPFPKTEEQKPSMSNLPPFAPSMPPASKPAANPTQTDGAGDSLADWKAEVARRRELAARQPGEGDRLLREHLLDMQQRLEGGGLLLPLEQRRTPTQGTKRKIRDGLASAGSISSAALDPSQSAAEASSLRQAQGDAAGDDDADAEIDEDAINSDLDDPDQHEDDENNEENTDQIMLCTYDKVQRVKNKWKCTLKDGIVKVGSTDYVFHKGQGEFEW